MKWIDLDALSMRRFVEPERLDALPADDPLARRSRLDLQRVHRAMRSLSILRQATASLYPTSPPHSILELGAGDGSLMLRFARSSPWQAIEVTLLDRQELVGVDTRERFRRLGWQATPLVQDVREWAHEASRARYDLCITTLFLHHFETRELESLLEAIAARCRTFVACEPRRNGLAWIGGHLLGLLGSNEVTREDGVKSVRAGFTGEELSALWPSNAMDWRLREYFAYPFTHCLVADGSHADQHGEAGKPG